MRQNKKQWNKCSSHLRIGINPLYSTILPAASSCSSSVGVLLICRWKDELVGAFVFANKCAEWIPSNVYLIGFRFEAITRYSTYSSHWLQQWYTLYPILSHHKWRYIHPTMSQKAHTSSASSCQRLCRSRFDLPTRFLPEKVTWIYATFKSCNMTSPVAITLRCELFSRLLQYP